jgi:hypothetical protein
VPSPDLISLFVRPLGAAGFEYMVTGAVAAIVYGEPRLTNDIDIIVALGSRDAERFAQAFDALDFYVPPPEVIAIEAARPTHGHFNVIHNQTALKADIYPAGEDPLHAWALPHRRSVRVAGASVWIAPPEYVIVRKLEYLRDGASDKHLRDVQAILAQHGELLDRATLEAQVKRLGLDPQWAAALRDRSGA